MGHLSSGSFVSPIRSAKPDRVATVRPKGQLPYVGRDRPISLRIAGDRLVEPMDKLFMDDSSEILFRLSRRKPFEDRLSLGVVLVGVVPEVDADGIIPEEEFCDRPQQF